MPNLVHRRLAIVLLSGLILADRTVLAQKASAPSAGTAAAPSAGTGNRTLTPNNNTASLPNSNPANGAPSERPIFLSGKVMLDDGSPVSTDVRIERVCGASTHLEGHVDGKGRFSFQLGSNQVFDSDAANSSSTFGSQGIGSQNSGLPSGFGSSRSTTTESLWACEIRAAYPGYRSDVLELSNRRSMDNPDVGVIVLHRLTNIKGTTISLTTANAPKGAVKNYEKGMQLAGKGKFDEAEQRLQEAVEVYPKYAQAWFALGQVQQRQNKPGEARKSYSEALAADQKYVSPYDQLALLAAQEGKWDDAAKYSQEAVDLNPVEFPSSFWYNAVANINLKHLDEAEKSAKALAKLDTQHRFPQIENLLAEIAVQRGDYPDAAAHLRSYLQLVPNAKNADVLKQRLLKIEEASAASKK